MSGNEPVHQARERMFNVPIIVLMMIAAIGLVHAVLVLLMSREQATDAMLLFAFIPGRYDLAVLSTEAWWIGWGAAIWTFVTYALIHGDLNHLFFNAVWLLAFGTPVARRFGALRFMVFCMVCAAGGAAVHLLTHYGEMLPMVGASAAISGAMAAAMRFAFHPGGPLGLWGGRPEAYRVPAVPLTVALRDPRVLAFLFVWFGLNAVFGLGLFKMPGFEQAVAWQAHIGGFVAGLIAFSILDPRSVKAPAKCSP